MITLFRACDTYALNTLKERMAEQIRQLPQKISVIGDPTQILRFELPCAPIDILTWLHNNQLSLENLYWSDRDGAFEVGGIGVCDQIQGNELIDHQQLFEYMETRLSPDNPHLRFYGGINFYPDEAEGEWQDFGTYRFSIPQFEVNRDRDQYVFAFNISLKEAEAASIDRILSQLDQLNFEQTTEYRKVPQVQTRKDTPDRLKWQEMFDSVMADIGKGKFAKIVLARQTVFDFDTDIRPMALIKHLKDMSPHCYHFCFQPNVHYGFLGASPERLFKRVGTEVQSEAVAGTIRRGKTTQEDEALAQKLENSSKIVHEHQFVVSDLTQKLTEFCRELDVEGRSNLLKLDSSQHMITRFQGRLKETSYDHELLGQLHPTPAVAGTPDEQVIPTIRALEPFHRGWYAAPVGYVGFDHAEFVVAIRSGLVHDNHLSLYAGAGIVQGSIAQGEWDEIEDKIGSFLKVFKK